MSKHFNKDEEKEKYNSISNPHYVKEEKEYIWMGE